MEEKSISRRNCRLSLIMPLEKGAELVYLGCTEDSVARALRMAFQSEGFSMADGTDKRGVFKLEAGTRFVSYKIALKVDIATKEGKVIARILDITPPLGDEKAGVVHIREIRKIVSYLRKFEIDD